MNPAEQALQLKDIHLPASPGIWPPAPGWWVLGLLIAVLLGWISLHLIRYWQHRKSQREIFSLLNELSTKDDTEQVQEFLTAVSTLLRRVALMKYPRAQVADLTGRDWLLFLDRHGGDGRFINGPGSVLEAGPYRNDVKSSAVDKQGLLQLAGQWIKQNTGRKQVG